MNFTYAGISGMHLERTGEFDFIMGSFGPPGTPFMGLANRAVARSRFQAPFSHLTLLATNGARKCRIAGGEPRV